MLERSAGGPTGNWSVGVVKVSPGGFGGVWRIHSLGVETVHAGLWAPICRNPASGVRGIAGGIDTR
eukprot:8482167-Pyramimonas_sp.AAC.1